MNDEHLVCFTAEWICDSYPQLRDHFKTYIDVVIETQRRFAESYNKLKEEKKKYEEELASSLLPMTNGANTGTKILS